MPVFIRPARVIVDDGGSGLAAIAAIAAAAVISSALAAVIADIITALAVAAAVAVLGSLAVLVVVLRRHGVAVAQTLPAPARAPVPARPAAAVQGRTAPRAIEALKPHPVQYRATPAAHVNQDTGRSV